MNHQTDHGQPGDSAEREYQRRRAIRHARARARLGSLGELIANVSAEPQTTQVWRQGADAERRVAGLLEGSLRGQPVALMHDRRIYRGGNIDHLAIGPGGVTVIDTKSTRSHVQLKTVGGLLSPRQTLLIIAGRNRTGELHKLERQMHTIQRILASGGLDWVTVIGVLCYPYATGIPRLGTLRTQANTILTHPRGAAKLAGRRGPITAEETEHISALLNRRLPPA